MKRLAILTAIFLLIGTFAVSNTYAQSECFCSSEPGPAEIAADSSVRDLDRDIAPSGVPIFRAPPNVWGPDNTLPYMDSYFGSSQGGPSGLGPK